MLRSIVLVVVLLMSLSVACAPDGSTPECAELEEQHSEDQRLYSILYLACLQSGGVRCDVFLLFAAADDRC